MGENDNKPTTLVLDPDTIKALKGESNQAKRIKLPPFWPDRPQAWIWRAEAEFHRFNVKEDMDKFYAVLAALDKDHVDEIGDLLNSESITNAYDKIKKKLLGTFGESEDTKFSSSNDHQPDVLDRIPSGIKNEA